MDIGIFDHFEEDGQLTLFGIEEELEELQASARERAARSGKRARETAGRQAQEAAGRQAQEAADRQMQETADSRAQEAAGRQAQKAQTVQAQPGDGIRIRSCRSCGKLLFVREDGGGYSAACNACGISYVQTA